MQRTSNKHTDQCIAEAVALFFGVRRVIRTKLAQGKKQDPSTWLRVETMKFIADQDAPKMKELATHLSITAPSATALVSGLVKSGLVKVITDPQDRRASRLTLTKKGERELHEALMRGMALLGEVFGVLSPKELKGFVAALRRIAEPSDDY